MSGRGLVNGWSGGFRVRDCSGRTGVHGSGWTGVHGSGWAGVHGFHGVNIPALPSSSELLIIQRIAVSHAATIGAGSAAGSFWAEVDQVALVIPGALGLAGSQSAGQGRAGEVGTV